MPSKPLRALLVNDASLLGHHGSALVTDQIVRLAGSAGMGVTRGWSWDAASSVLAENGAPFDLVIVNGEGSIHDDSRSAVRIAGMARDLAARKSPPAYLVNATVEGNSPGVDAGLGAFRLRFVRDRQSQETLARAGVAADVVHDLTLSAALLPKARGLGPLLVTDASDQGKSRRLMALARTLADADAITLRAPPPWPARGSPARRIGFEVKRAAARFAAPSPWSLRYAGAVPFPAFVDRLANGTRGLVCGRYHAVCLALRMSLPFVAVDGNTGKVSALLSDIGLSQRLTTLEALERAGSTLDVAAFSAEETERIGRFVADVGTKAADMFSRIAADARARQQAPVAAA